MLSKKLAKLALAGVFALAPATTFAYDGVLINCDPTDGVAIPVELDPGLGCDDAVNKIGIEATVNGCSDDAGAPWDTWAAAKYPTKKLNAAAAALVDSVEIKVKAKTFGSCNFSGSTTSGGAGGGGKFKMLSSAGDKLGSGSFFGTVGGDLGTASAVAQGIITKGELTASSITVTVGIDTGHPDNANILACNIGAACPPPIPPSETLQLKTAAGNSLKIGNPQDSDCTAASLPWACCTGVGTGNC